MQKLERKSEKAHDRLDAAREKLPTHKVLKKERVFDEETGKGKGVWGFPKNQNGRIGCKAEPLIFPVCTDTGCACYSPKSHIRRYTALPLSQKQGRIFFENFSFRYLRFDLKMSVVK